MKRAFRVTIVVVILALVLVWAFMPSPVPADFATVQRGSLQVTVDEEGRTRVRDRYVISAPLPGSMRRIELEPGDAVVAGKTLLAEFHPTEPSLLDVRTRAELEARVRAATSALGSARADRERIQSNVGFAQSELQRAQQLMKDKVISQRELETAQQQAQTAERGLQSADFAVRTAEYNLQVARASLLQAQGGGGSVIKLYSPVDGVVLRRLQESEAVVPTGTPLMEVGDLSNLEIVSDLLSTAAVKVKAGQPVIIEQWGGDHPLAGRVRRVEPSGFTKISALGVEEQRVNTIVDFDAQPDVRKSIGDGYRVELRIVVWERPDILKVPASGLFRAAADWAVFRVDGDVAKRQLVEVGQQNGLDAEIVKGLAAGDRIIVYPSDAIRDGIKVRSR